jgi:MFS family permease
VTTVWADRTFSSLRRHRNYRLYFAGQLVSVTGTWMQDAALPWVVLQQTGSAVDVGLLMLCRFGPYLLLGLHVGAFADRFDNRRSMIAAQVVMLVASALLAVLVLAGTTPLWAIFLLATIGGVGLILDSPNRHALTFQLVGRDELANAVSLNSSMFNLARTAGPALGGILIAAVGAGWCFVFNAVSFLAILAALVAIRPDELFPVRRSPERPPVLQSIADGLRFSARSVPVRTVLVMMLVVSLVGFNFRVLVPALADKTLNAGATTFGLLFASFGFGSLIGALAAAAHGRTSWTPLVGGAILWNCALLAIAPLDSTALAAVLLFAAGAGFTLWLASSQAMLQLSTPDHLRGRVMSVFLLIVGGLQPIGGVIAGWLTDLRGTGLSFTVAGLTGLLATSSVLWARRGGSRRTVAAADETMAA